MVAMLLSDERSASLYPAVYNSFMVGPAVQVELIEFTDEDERSSKRVPIVSTRSACRPAWFAG